jgi:hypothetical protein
VYGKLITGNCDGECIETGIDSLWRVEM